jgi:hypothetical protein
VFICVHLWLNIFCCPPALNACITRPVQRKFEIAVAERGITKQKAVEEALQLWIARQSALRKRKMGQAPIIQSHRRSRTLNLTTQDIDEILFG